ncbi:MAG: hypothetical protein ACLUG9_06995 [Paraclostridium sordellii]|uniref:hypothetical protein n=1 Tax=Paraclostridium sordellii TaxID=1505 RepID=UPI0005E143B5|nr:MULTISPECIES: hypothetical protein [Paeniclostridium]MBW4864352.1 hypothetical protein [Paeniclostridium sp.]MBW4873524.1 hypothetical protein [Paeniclostridium sp.]MDU4412861.1 hypothetical protein [Paeniclostridium sordellii]MRZ29395.1 hypothetical protein [Paeniclostridium sordellii]MVO74912.1 hypothetical protein [Paeniclostridium sordellii]
MKKFLAICIVIFVVALFTIGNILSSKSAPKDGTYFTKTKGKDIYIVKNDKWEKLEIVGVGLDSTKPGAFPSENLVNEEDYLRWIKDIYDMGANCIKVSNLMGANFYKALDKFNKDKKNPIYLMQGIYFDEKLLKNGKDPQGSKASSAFKDNIKLVIDSVHGNPYNKEKPDILQVYKTDISKYVIGYSLGIQFAKHDLIYTEIMNNKKPYDGKYMYTDKNSSSFESYLAKMGDYAVDYEFSTYKKQSLISFIGTSAHHIASSVENPNKKNILSSKDTNEEFKNFIDVEDIKAKRGLKTGIVASYNIYPSYTELKEYDGNIGKYFEDINKHYSIPVIIGEIGVPSSRSGGDFNENTDKGYITEQEQGKALVDIYKAVKKSKLAGCFIFEFQDSWYSSSWNTKDNKILDRSAYWSDAQTYSQSFGLMTFEPGRLKVTPYPDDKLDEWSEKNVISKDKDYSLSMQSDEKYLYFMIKSSDKTSLKKDDIYIDLDTTPKSGSKKSTQYGLQFDNPVDFIIKINDQGNSMVMAQEYYNGFDFYENKSLYEKRPDLIKHTPDMDYFSPIYIETRPKMFIKSQGETKEKVTYETGKLTKGNSNPESKDFNSAADYYMGNDYVEVRIPWALLNFMDPSTKQIADDFYENFKTKPMKINDINVGVTIKENEKVITRIKSTPYKLNGWSVPKYHERLKKSYYILKEELSKK